MTQAITDSKMMSGSKMPIVGTALTLAAVAGGVYLLTGKRGEKNRETLKGWAVQAKDAVMKKLAGLKEVSQEKYEAIVDEVMSRYQATKDVTLEELSKLKKDLKSYWQDMVREMKTSAASREATNTENTTK